MNFIMMFLDGIWEFLTLCVASALSELAITLKSNSPIKLIKAICCMLGSGIAAIILMLVMVLYCMVKLPYCTVKSLIDTISTIRRP